MARTQQIIYLVIGYGGGSEYEESKWNVKGFFEEEAAITCCEHMNKFISQVDFDQPIDMLQVLLEQEDPNIQVFESNIEYYVDQIVVEE